MDGRGSPNINLGIFVCSFEDCWVSISVPSFNYVRVKDESEKVGGRKTLFSYHKFP